MNNHLKRDVYEALKYSNNPFKSDDGSTVNETLASIYSLLKANALDSILEVLQILESELSETVKNSKGSITAMEITLPDRERLWNCRAAIKHFSEQKIKGNQ